MMCLEIKAIKHLMLCTPVGKSIQMSQLDIHYPGTIKHGRTRGCPPQCLFVLRTYAHLKLANKILNLEREAKKDGRKEKQSGGKRGEGVRRWVARLTGSLREEGQRCSSVLWIRVS